MRLPVSLMELVAWIVKVDGPPPLGVPVMAPVLPFNDSPVGSVPDVTANV